jgi:hypothetical protein
VFVKPAPGLLVRDDVSKVRLPAEGREVPETSYWVRRLRCGDVVLASPPPAPPARPAPIAVSPDPVLQSGQIPDSDSAPSEE